MNRVYLGIGSNRDREQHLRACVQLLACSFRRLRISPVYRSPAYGFDGADFYNLAACIDTHFRLQPLKRWLQGIEDAHRRDRSAPRYSDRTLDIDVLLFNRRVQSEPVQLPRAELVQRDYVLRPMVDLAPELMHPVHKKRLADLWQALADTADLQRLDWSLSDELFPHHRR